MALLLACLAAAQAPTLRGVVRGAGGPLPGAQVEAVQGAAKLETVTGADGAFALPQAGSGSWDITVKMTGFDPARETAAVGGPALAFELKLKPYAGAALQAAPPPPASSGRVAAPDAALAINGSEDNGAASPFALSPAFGNHRPGARSLYNGGFGLRFDSSQLDARTFSLTGQATPRPSYNDLTEFLQIGGPLLLPHLTNANNAPVFFAAYERRRDRSALNSAALVPTAAQRAAATSPQARALIAFYPVANVMGAGFNYQAALPSDLHQDSLQTRLSRFFSATNQVSGTFDLQSTRGSATNLFGFTDANGGLGLNAGVQWRHSFSRDFFSTFALQYSRMATRLTPFFASRVNIAANAGIAGGDASPANWGPPTLAFSSGLASLSDGLAQRNRNQTAAFSYAGTWIRNDHDWSFGGDFRRLEFNLWQQQNPRGSFTFNGDATGNDVQDFLQGRADAVAVAFGNADKYFRQSSYDAFVTDDWHASDGLTLNLGLRWEYGAPMRERYGRLVNLATGPGFNSATAQVLADGGLRPDRRGLEPRLGVAWRPLAASSLLVSAGYGIYYDSSVYLSLAEQMAQQAPLSRSLAVAATAQTPLTLATGLETPAGATPAVFGVDPGFRPGYAQTWNLALQNDLPGGYVASVTYLGTKGTHGVQRFYPNTYPPGSSNPCPACPVGFLYEASNGNSTLNSGKAVLQRRYHNGLAFTASYTYENAMDDAALGGGGAATASVVAQNWRDLDAERARSSFDRRHQFSLQAQYSTGSRVLGGWLGRAYHEWTLTSQVTAMSGAPLTPLTFALVPGTGFTGVRPDVTGAAAGAAPPGLFVNPLAFAAPAPGQWGNAGRNTIEGPSQFGLNASLQRSFAVRGGLTANLRLDATNALNHVSYTGWNTTLGSPLFGLPLGATPMRSLLATLRFEF